MPSDGTLSVYYPVLDLQRWMLIELGVVLGSQYSFNEHLWDECMNIDSILHLQGIHNVVGDRGLIKNNCTW